METSRSYTAIGGARIVQKIAMLIAVGATIVIGLSDAVSAQDIDAVERRLGNAVGAGELSLEQASIMLEALMEHALVEEGGMEERKRAFMEYERELAMAVREGDVSREEAEAALEDAHRELFGEHEEEYEKEEEMKRGGERDEELARRKREYMETERWVAMKVEEGIVNKQEAQKIMAQMRKELFGQYDEEKEEYEEDIDERQLELRRRRFMQFEAQLRAKVESGEVSREEAEQKLNELRQKMSGQMSSQQDRAASEADEKRNADQLRNNTRIEMNDRRQRLMEFEKQINAKIEAGEVSREEGEALLAKVRSLLINPSPATSPDGGVTSVESQTVESQSDDGMEMKQQRYMEYSRMLSDAIEAGKITEEEAEKKLLEVREKMFGEEEAEEHNHAAEMQEHDHGTEDHDHADHDHSGHDHDAHDHSDHEHSDHDHAEGEGDHEFEPELSV